MKEIFENWREKVLFEQSTPLMSAKQIHQQLRALARRFHEDTMGHKYSVHSGTPAPPSLRQNTPDTRVYRVPEKDVKSATQMLDELDDQISRRTAAGKPVNQASRQLSTSVRNTLNVRVHPVPDLYTKPKPIPKKPGGAVIHPAGSAAAETAKTPDWARKRPQTVTQPGWATPRPQTVTQPGWATPRPAPEVTPVEWPKEDSKPRTRKSRGGEKGFLLIPRSGVVSKSPGFLKFAGRAFKWVPFVGWAFAAQGVESAIAQAKSEGRGNKKRTNRLLTLYLAREGLYMSPVGIPLSILELMISNKGKWAQNPEVARTLADLKMGALHEQKNNICNSNKKHVKIKFRERQR